MLRISEHINALINYIQSAIKIFKVMFVCLTLSESIPMNQSGDGISFVTNDIIV